MSKYTAVLNDHAAVPLEVTDVDPDPELGIHSTHTSEFTTRASFHPSMEHEPLHSKLDEDSHPIHHRTSSSSACCHHYWKLLYGIIIVLVIVMGSLAVKGIFDKSKSSPSPTPTPDPNAYNPSLHTTLPNSTRDMMLSMMNHSVDPCEDMYRYACGGWIAATNVSQQPSNPFVYGVSTLSTRTDQQIQAIITNDTGVMGHLFRSCMNTSDIDVVGVTPMLPILSHITSHVTTLDSMFYTIGQLQRGTMMVGMILMPQDPIMDIETHMYVFTISAEFPLEILPQFNFHGYASLFGISNTTITSAVEKYKLLHQIADSFKMNPHPPNITMIPRTALSSEMDAYLRGLGDTTILNQLNITSSSISHLNNHITNTTQSITRIQIVIPTLLWKLRDEMATWTDEERNHVTQLLCVLAAFPFMPLSIQGAIFPPRSPPSPITFSLKYPQKRQSHALSTYLPTSNSPSPSMNSLLSSQATACFTLIKDIFQDQLIKQWILKYYPQQHTALVTYLAQQVYAAQGNRLKKNEWLDDTTKQAALSKWASIVINPVSYSNFISPPSNLPFTGHFLWDLSIATNWGMDMIILPSLEIIIPRNQIDRNTDTKPYQANAYYSPALNSVNLLAGMLLAPELDIENPFWYNVASYGTVIGHELSHAFDNTGRLYDGLGNRVSWWSNTSESQFQTRATCLIEDYHRYQISGTLIDGNQTLGENMADIGGYGAAWDVYASLPGQPDLIPNLSNDQLFWIAAAQNWCTASTPAALLGVMLIDRHSPGEARVNVAMSHEPEFAHAFHCTATSRMGKSKNPQHCQVW